MKRVLTVFGTRPEAIKMCPLAIELAKNQNIENYVCVTGQHREMLDQVLKLFKVVPDFDLSIMKPRQTLFSITSEILMRIDDVFSKIQPDLILVHGDTTTSYAVALAAFYKQIPIGHVEAGLRTHDFYSPFPEEFNRVSVDLISSIWFAPTKAAAQNLLNEGKSASRVFVTGNTGIDALRTTIKGDYHHSDLEWANNSRFLLITAHRRENIGNPMRAMFRAIRQIVDSNPNVKAIYPVHRNPAVREIAHSIFDGCDNVKLIEPLDVFDFHNFMARSYLILTDSGGIQEEAPTLGKPVLVMRDTTERPEGVEAGTLKLVGTDEQTIIGACNLLLNDSNEYQTMARASNPYGDGYASSRIANIITDIEIG